MNLANAYAAVVKEAEGQKEKAEFVKKLVAFMKSRGHLSLIPQVVRIVSREHAGADAAVVTVAKEHDAKKFAHQIREALSTMSDLPGHLVRIDPRAVGGYSVRAKGKLVDKTFRSALVSIYQNTIHP